VANADIWDRFEAMLKVSAPALLASLRPPATIEQIEVAEGAMSLRLPDDVRKAYLRHNGSVSGEFPRTNDSMLLFVPFHWWASLAEMTEMWIDLAASKERSRASDPDLFPLPEPFWDELKCKPVYGNERWIPIGLSGTVSIVYIDLDPAPRGVVGQVMKDTGVLEPTCIAKGFDHYLEMLIERVERGALIFRDGWIWTETDEHVTDWNRVG